MWVGLYLGCALTDGRQRMPVGDLSDKCAAAAMAAVAATLLLGAAESCQTTTRPVKCWRI